MILKCNVCKESPTVVLPEPENEGQEILCPSCGKQLAWGSEDLQGNLYWHPVDTAFNKEWGGCPVTIIQA